MRKTGSFFLSLLCTSIKGSISIRGAFILEAILMVTNNIIFFSIWFIFFRQFNDIAGWKIDDMIVLIAIGTGAYGLMQLCFGGIKVLSKTIVTGDLDSYMTQPKNILLHAIGSKSNSRGWGNILTSVIALFLGPFTSLSSICLALMSMVSGCLVFASVGIIAHSMAFWLGSVESLSRKYCDALFLFALYPTNIYSGFLQFVMFTFIPAGLIGYVPVELIRNFSIDRLIILLLSSVGFAALSFFVFYAGIKRYESGNRFGMRA
ncbi:MAG: ABC-2 family transporter protein [Chlamydiota bacterium]